ncbi:bestrophin-4-like [Macrobrachium nipponense]|uniref:bestrophin-4-like n=1 Tax=Macrobrachium nipponense TaxID=159736 RepID=UPI0030C7A362
MTVTYTHEVAECRGLGNFWRLLFRWRGSIYKLVWPDLLVYSMCYYTCSIIYRVVLNEEQKKIFEMITLYCNHYSDLIPVSFVLGFYVSIVIQRWWAQYETLPWPDSLSLFISTSIQGQDNRGRLMRRTIVRYVNLAFTITLTMITSRAKKRFPTLDHLVEAGLMTVNEKKIFDGMTAKTNHPLHWLPLVWAGSVVARARKENRIRDDFAVKTIIDEINNFRGKCGGLLSYDWISIPLVYTQVVTLAVYSFFFSTIMGRQFLDPAKKFPNHDLDFYVPVFTFLQFFFYMGWLKVAESLVNPFGEDDDDFEVNYLIDRNLQISYMIVDEMHEEHPELIQDIYWEEVFPAELPYTIALSSSGGTRPWAAQRTWRCQKRIKNSCLSLTKNLKMRTKRRAPRTSSRRSAPFSPLGPRITPEGKTPLYPSSREGCSGVTIGPPKAACCLFDGRRDPEVSIDLLPGFLLEATSSTCLRNHCTRWEVYAHGPYPSSRRAKTAPT